MKRMIVVALCLVIALSLTACPAVKPSSSISSNSGSSSDPFEPENKTIKTSWFVDWWTKEEDSRYIFDEFARKYPDYEIIDEFIPDIATLVAAMQSNTQPDFFMGGESREVDFGLGCWQNTFAPLDKYLKDDPIVNFETLENNQLDLGKFLGSYYSLPYISVSFCLNYNKKLFAEAGLDPERPPQTFSELYDYAKKLTKFDSNGNISQAGIMCGGYMTGPFAWLTDKLNGTNGTMRGNGIDSNIDSEWHLYINEYEASFSQIYGNGKTPEGVTFGMTEGNVAMNTWGGVGLNGLTQKLGEDVGFAPLPHPDDYPDVRYIPSFTWYYFAIPKGAKNPDGGWFFTKFAMTDGIYLNQLKDYESNPYNFIPSYIAHIPTREKIYADFLTDVNPVMIDMLYKRDELMEGNIVNMFSSPLQLTLNKIGDKWNKKQENGEVNLKEKLAGIHTEYQAQVAIWKASMVEKGWTFSEDLDTPPIPPANYNN